MAISEEQFHVLGHMEIATSTISFVCTFLMIASFFYFRRLRTPANTLIVYASASNVFANMATVMGTGHSARNRGVRCQTQAFLIEWFMQSDPLWSLMLAINVYLCIFWHYDTARLKKLYWVYALVAYGLPLIPAIFCLVYQHKGLGRMYGNAQLWCWIKNEYTDFRIWTFYLPIWVSIILSLAIYVRVGATIWKVRKDIMKLSNENSEFTSTSNSYSSDAVLVKDNFADEKAGNAQSVKRTITFHVESTPRVSTQDEPRQYRANRFNSIDAMVLSQPMPALIIEEDDSVEDDIEHNHLRATRSRTSSQGSCLCSPLDPPHTHCSVAPTQTRDSVASGRPPQKSRSNMQRIQWQYTKSAALFTISILITWIPPSINRARTLTRPGIAPSFTLVAMSACVLPLQGFWNSLIFALGSWGVIKSGLRKWQSERKARK